VGISNCSTVMAICGTPFSHDYKRDTMGTLRLCHHTNSGVFADIY
jgi:hypothetical protein